MAPNKYKMDPAGGCKWVPPRLDPLLEKSIPRASGVSAMPVTYYMQNKTHHLGHLADVLELNIHIREGTTFNLICSGHNDSLPRLRARLSSRNVVRGTELTSLHETGVNATGHGFVDVFHVLTELR
jgi:hypothetical protein